MRRVNLGEPSFDYDEERPEGFRRGKQRLGDLLGASQLGATLYELPPGQAVCPYHYEYGEEEWLLVLSGRPTVRHPEGSDELAPLDLVCFTRGPQGAHRVGNETDETVQVLMFSAVVFPTATVYPDSGKIGVWTGDPDHEITVPRDAAVDYWHGEPDAG